MERIASIVFKQAQATSEDPRARSSLGIESHQFQTEEDIMTLIDTSRLQVKEPREGWKGRFFNTRNMTFAYYTVKAGASIHEHSHPNEEVWNVIEGQLEIKIHGETIIAGPGCAAVIPPDMSHSVRALTDARAIVVDHPPRTSIGGVDL